MAGERITDLGINGLTAAVEIGEGGFATVYRARQTALGRFVAVKVFRDLTVDDTTLAIFERECQAVGRVGGRRNILVVYDQGITSGGRPYMIMPFMTGGSLLDRLQRQRRLPWPEVAELGAKLARALQTAHDAAVLHRDVKPANVLLDDDGEPQLADFGIARLTDTTRTATNHPSFTPAHVAPEVLKGAPATPLVDVYSLASTLFELLAGHPAFVTGGDGSDDSFFAVMRRVESAPVPDLRPVGVPDDVCRVIEWAMAKEPAQRPASAGAFATALDQVRTPKQAEATVPTQAFNGRPLTQTVPLPPKSRTPLIAGVVAGAALLIALVAIVIVATRPSPTPTTTGTTVAAPATTVTTGATTTTVPATTVSTVSPVALQAQALNTLLGRSSSDRSAIVMATQDIGTCGSLSLDQATLDAAAQSRQTLLNQLAQLNVSQVPNASTLMSTLTSAWHASLQSDNNYAAWANDLEVGGGCAAPASADPNWQAARASDAQATAAKNGFVATWNPIAAAYGLPQYTQAQI
ncbi:MAG TPA: serine/threonine-protein kinase [Acidimicrobiales bacterium]|jgi:serine/threonine protein kinase|nr:serine/threonine-protein kinase [Acidimicrobiales bacterium]